MMGRDGCIKTHALQRQQQEEEKERLREEQRLKELECEKIKAQLEALE